MKNICVSNDGGVYLTETLDDAVKFAILRVHDEPIYVFGIDGLDIHNIVETFDHNYNIFQCRSYMYMDAINLDSVMYKVHKIV